MTKVVLTGQPFVIVEPEAIASWLEQDPNTLWTVDGEDEIAELINLPARPEEIADLLRGHGGKLRVFAPPAAIDSWKKSSHDVAALVQPDAEGEPAFFLAWDGEKDPKWPAWALVRDVFAEQTLAALG